MEKLNIEKFGFKLASDAGLPDMVTGSGLYLKPSVGENFYELSYYHVKKDDFAIVTLVSVIDKQNRVEDRYEQFHRIRIRNQEELDWLMYNCRFASRFDGYEEYQSKNISLKP